MIHLIDIIVLIVYEDNREFSYNKLDFFRRTKGAKMEIFFFGSHENHVITKLFDKLCKLVDIS